MRRSTVAHNFELLEQQDIRELDLLEDMAKALGVKSDGFTNQWKRVMSAQARVKKLSAALSEADKVLVATGVPRT